MIVAKEQKARLSNLELGLIVLGGLIALAVVLLPLK